MTYNPKKTPVSEENSSASETNSAASLVGSVDAKRRQRKVCTIFHPEHKICTYQYAQTMATKAADDCDSDISVEKIEGAKNGWNPVKSEWAFDLWPPRPLP